MPNSSLEVRMKTVENEVAKIQTQIALKKDEVTIPWYEAIAGTFANSEGYEDAMRLGREYRESLRPKEGEDDEEDAEAA